MAGPEQGEGTRHDRKGKVGPATGGAPTEEEGRAGDAVGRP